MRPSAQRCCFAILLAALTGLALGCQKERPAPAGPESGDHPADPAPGGTPEPRTEDPEAAAYFKTKGWKLVRDQRLMDGRRQIYLYVEDRDTQREGIVLSDDDYKMIARSRAVQVLDLRKVKCTDAGMKTVAAIPQLEGIVVSGEDVTDAGMKALAGCKTLDSVALISTRKVTDAGIQELAALPRLQVLGLLGFPLDGSGFAPFAGSKTLTTLSLYYIDGFTDDGARNLAKLPALNELSIQTGFGEQKLTTAGIRAIVDARVPARFEFDLRLLDDALLEALVARGWLYGPAPPRSGVKKPGTPEEVWSINLDDSRITDRGFAAVLHCTNVKSLFLRGTDITDESLRKLAAFKRLDYLSLDKTKLTGAGLDALAGLPIKHVAMQECELSEDAFRAFSKLTALEELSLRNAKMKAEWLKHLSGLPKLKKLDLTAADFDDAAVKYLTALPALEELTVTGTRLGDAGFQELLKHPNLQKIYVDGTKVTKEVCQKAKKDYPNRRLSFSAYDQ
jgi:hypothetical protein